MSGREKGLEIDQQICEIVADNSALSLDDVTAAANLFDAGLSSLECVRILLAVEDEFNIELPEDVINRELFSNVANLRAAVDQALGVSA